ncbi:Thioredoxin-like protein [Glarea lozoyensis ATCC 20868]|uniref:Thioredoxin-like protein n=1 Tax=Glarea lozoyensis (strain ATCC 20868 / MF5171) TaxID=1116229 RepID=S3D2H1_GLAL2|nr:Thioredoxin-like protein [Glarea lozoyensis ATCC 20868]EPE26236.1 Thioredoxin-like protein [Glarea lozoyensis ATCC 20868]
MAQKYFAGTDVSSKLLLAMRKAALTTPIAPGEFGLGTFRRVCGGTECVGVLCYEEGNDASEGMLGSFLEMAQSSAVIAENAVFQRIPTSKYVVFKKGVHDYMFDYFKIKTVPTVMFFKRGDIVGAHEGGNVKEFEKAILSQFAEALAPTHYCKGDYPDWCNTREYCAAWDLNAVEKGGPLDPKINRK